MEIHFRKNLSSYLIKISYHVLLTTLFLSVYSNTFAKVIHYPLGDETVLIHIFDQGNGLNFIHLHNNEITSLKAAQSRKETCKGVIISLSHSGERLISFRLNNSLYTFDPNRIFTKIGIKKTLSKYSHFNPKAAQLIYYFSEKLISLIPKTGPIIALHNNKYYSMKNYYPDGNMANDAKAYYKNPELYFRNFYFVTSVDIYKTLKKNKYNVVLQNNEAATDDGSLSIALSNRKYINIEAGYDQLKEQIELVNYICNLYP